MKKIILILTLLITTSLVFAYEDVNIKNDPYFKDLEIPKGVIVVKTQKEKWLFEEKTNLWVYREKKEVFLKRVRINGNTEVFSNTATVTMEDIFEALKEGKEIWYMAGYDHFSKYIWYESNTNGISAGFGQTELWGRVNSFGNYGINIFLDDYVYTFLLSSPKTIEERSGPMDGLAEYMYFKKGLVTNLEKGIEGNQGYYWKKKEFQEKYFNDLTAKKKTLPKEVIEFQTTYEELIRNIIEHFE